MELVEVRYVTADGDEYLCQVFFVTFPDEGFIYLP